MPNNGHETVRTSLASQLDRLWRFGLVLSGSRAAEDRDRLRGAGLLPLADFVAEVAEDSDAGRRLCI
jgi:hypothetical protein